MDTVFKTELFHIGNYVLGLGNIIIAAGIAIIFFIALKIAKRSLYSYSSLPDSKKYSVYSLIKYLAWVVFSILIFQALGFNLSIILAGSAALLVGLGLGLQNLFSDYISGLIILFDGSIKVGDVIEVNSLVSRVSEIKLRTTQVVTRDDKYIIIPNTELTRNQVINWTHDEISSRFEISVGVAYSSEVNQAMEIMIQATMNNQGVLKQPQAFARLNDFADSSLILTVYFWSNEVFRIDNIRSQIRKDILTLFRENNITIPFPQRVVYNG